MGFVDGAGPILRKSPAAGAGAMLCVAGAMAAIWSGSVAGQGARDPAPGFPAKSIRLVLPFATGDVLDAIMRVIIPKTSETLGQSIFIDNKPGATGNIGMDIVAKSPPDGYTMGMLIISHSVNAAVNGPKMPFDILRDFSAITQLTGNAYVLSVGAKLPVKSVAELIAYARANPGAVRYGSSGTGGVIHLAGEMVAQAGKVKMVHVPYKGNALAMTDIVGGHIEWMFSSLTIAAPLHARGQIRSIAVSSAQRLAAAPELPTMQEAGLAGFEVSGWYGLVGPARMPAGLVEKLNGALVGALRTPDVKEKLEGMGLQVVGSTPARFDALLRAEDEKWKRAVKSAGLTGD